MTFNRVAHKEKSCAVAALTTHETCHHSFEMTNTRLCANDNLQIQETGGFVMSFMPVAKFIMVYTMALELIG